MSLAKKAISGAIWMSGINYIGFAVNFGIQLALVRLLVPEDFGLFALGLSVAEILFIFFSFSFPMAVIQIQEAEHVLDTAFYLTLFTGFIILLIGGVISLLVLLYYPFPSVLAFFILCVLQIPQGCSSIYSASMEKELQFKKNAIIRGVATNLSGFGAIILAYFSFGVWSLIGRECISAFLMLFGMRLVSRYRFQKRFNRETAKRLLNFSYKMLFSRGLEIVYHRIPNFFIGTFAGAKALGLFTQSYYLANLPNTVLGPAHQNVAFAVYSKIQNEREKMSRAFYITNFFFVRLMFPYMLIMFFYPTEMLKILYGHKWLEATSIFRFFGIYAALLPIFSNSKTIAYCLGKLTYVSKVYLIETLFFSIGLFVALYTGRIYLIALAYSVSLFLGLLIILYALKKEKINLFSKELFSIPIFTALTIILLWSLISKVPVMSFVYGDKVSLVIIPLFALIFMILPLFFEIRVVLENIRYIIKRLG